VLPTGCFLDLEEIARNACLEAGFDTKDKGLDCKSASLIYQVEVKEEELNVLEEKARKAKADDNVVLHGYATDEWDS